MAADKLWSQTARGELWDEGQAACGDSPGYGGLKRADVSKGVVK